jgi:hypothetical protein
MIVSYLYNFIFIKTQKTGGTAAEVALATNCGPDDIVTPLGPNDELARGNGHPVCRNFTSDSALEQELKDALMRGDVKAFRKAREASEYFAHMTAAEMKEKLAPGFWNSAYKITVERHPYEKAVSAAYFRYRGVHRTKEFSDYLDEFISNGKYTTFRFYAIDGEPVVNEFLRQESLADDLRRVGARLGLPMPAQAARMKSNLRQDTRPAREILNDRQKEIVYEFCKKEFDLLGYER